MHILLSISYFAYDEQQSTLLLIKINTALCVVKCQTDKGQLPSLTNVTQAEVTIVSTAALETLGAR